MTKFTSILILLSCFFKNTLQSQPSVIFLQNPSFEDEPGYSRTPIGWFFCGVIGESPPDIHPAELFGVGQNAVHGNTYVGMVVRDNGTWEGLSQWLEVPLQAGQCYQFSLYAARSLHYESVSRINNLLTNYDKPVVLRVWAGNLNCERSELLAVSDVVESTNWQRFIFNIKPTQSYNRVVLEAYYTNDAKAYCGNVLLDHITPFVPMSDDCLLPKVKIDTLQLNESISSIESSVIETAQKVIFSDVNNQPEQHIFYLPNGDMEQCNRYLYSIVHLFKNEFRKKIIFYIIESDKKRFRAKEEKLVATLFLLGLSERQFLIQRYNNEKMDMTVPMELIVRIR